MARKILIGTVQVYFEQDVVDRSFQYAADFAKYKLHTGIYPIFAYADDLKKRDGRYYLGWRNYIEYSGELISDSFGSKPGTNYTHLEHIYDYLIGGNCITNAAKYQLLPQWKIELADCTFDHRCFIPEIYTESLDGLDYENWNKIKGE